MAQGETDTMQEREAARSNQAEESDEQKDGYHSEKEDQKGETQMNRCKKRLAKRAAARRNEEEMDKDREKVEHRTRVLKVQRDMDRLRKKNRRRIRYLGR